MHGLDARAAATAQAHASRGASRIRWLLGAAVSIGGTGIWVMHFIAMMGFEVQGTQIRYDVPLTVASAVVAIVVVGTGLFLVSYGRADCSRCSAAAY